MERLDICDENGIPTGQTIERTEAHRLGICHRTAHVWLTRKHEGRWQILLQKRAANKDSFPGCWDTSSAGHIPAGCTPLSSALRELQEELGIAAVPAELTPIGRFTVDYTKVFHDVPFHDHEVIHVYLCRKPILINTLRLQETEVEEAAWFDLQYVLNARVSHDPAFCVPSPSLQLLRDALLRIE